MKKQALKVLLISTFSIYLLVFLVGELLFNGSMIGEGSFLKKSDYYFLLSIPLISITAITISIIIQYFADRQKEKKV